MRRRSVQLQEVPDLSLVPVPPEDRPSSSQQATRSLPPAGPGPSSRASSTEAQVQALLRRDQRFSSIDSRPPANYHSRPQTADEVVYSSRRRGQGPAHTTVTIFHNDLPPKPSSRIASEMTVQQLSLDGPAILEKRRLPVGVPGAASIVLPLSARPIEGGSRIVSAPNHSQHGRPSTAPPRPQLGNVSYVDSEGNTVSEFRFEGSEVLGPFEREPRAIASSSTVYKAWDMSTSADTLFHDLSLGRFSSVGIGQPNPRRVTPPSSEDSAPSVPPPPPSAVPSQTQINSLPDHQLLLSSAVPPISDHAENGRPSMSIMPWADSSRPQSLVGDGGLAGPSPSVEPLLTNIKVSAPVRMTRASTDGGAAPSSSVTAVRTASQPGKSPLRQGARNSGIFTSEGGGTRSKRSSLVQPEAQGSVPEWNPYGDKLRSSIEAAEHLGAEVALISIDDDHTDSVAIAPSALPVLPSTQEDKLAEQAAQTPTPTPPPASPSRPVTAQSFLLSTGLLAENELEQEPLVLSPSPSPAPPSAERPQSPLGSRPPSPQISRSRSIVDLLFEETAAETQPASPLPPPLSMSPAPTASPPRSPAQPRSLSPQEKIRQKLEMDVDYTTFTGFEIKGPFKPAEAPSFYHPVARVIYSTPVTTEKPATFVPGRAASPSARRELFTEHLRPHTALGLPHVHHDSSPPLPPPEPEQPPPTYTAGVCNTAVPLPDPIPAMRGRKLSTKQAARFGLASSSALPESKLGLTASEVNVLHSGVMPHPRGLLQRTGQGISHAPDKNTARLGASMTGGGTNRPTSSKSGTAREAAIALLSTRPHTSSNLPLGATGGFSRYPPGPLGETRKSEEMFSGSRSSHGLIPGLQPGTVPPRYEPLPMRNKRASKVRISVSQAGPSDSFMGGRQSSNMLNSVYSSTALAPSFYDPRIGLLHGGTFSSNGLLRPEGQLGVTGSAADGGASTKRWRRK